MSAIGEATWSVEQLAEALTALARAAQLPLRDSAAHDARQGPDAADLARWVERTTAWLGLEAWLLPWVVPEVLAHARRVVSVFGADAGVIAFANREALLGGGYLLGTAPPWRRRAKTDGG